MFNMGLVESVAVIITTFNDGEYLAEALRSVISQQYIPTEIIVVDDGSRISANSIVEKFAGVALFRKKNGGLASARNAGLQEARSHFITFLDADDRLDPNALSAGIACFRGTPDAAFVYGGHRRIRGDGATISGDIYQAPSDDPYADLLRRNLIGMHATVLYRRDILIGAGGFDERLRRCEDYDVYLRLAKKHAIGSHSATVAEYRWHGRNMSSKPGPMLRAALRVHRRHRHHDSELRLVAWREGRKNWKEWYTHGQQAQWGRQSEGGRAMARRFLSLLTRIFHRLFHLRRSSWPPTLGKIDFGHLRTTRPINNDFGWGRGTQIDRKYIEAFLQKYSRDIRGRVLEVGSSDYSQRFGGANIARQDILHVDPESSTATLTGDLTIPGVLPESAFDCIVFTQTLHLIFDLPAAVSRLYAALKPSGILLLTVPGISQIDRHEWGSQWYWSLTPSSLRRLFANVFSEADFDIEQHGNVFAAISFLTGAVVEEVDSASLEVNDRAYPLIITMRAKKA